MEPLPLIYGVLAFWWGFGRRRDARDATAGEFDERSEEQLAGIRFRVGADRPWWVDTIIVLYPFGAAVFVLSRGAWEGLSWAVLAAGVGFGIYSQRQSRQTVLAALGDRGQLDDPLRRDASASRRKWTQRFGTAAATLFALSLSLVLLVDLVDSVAIVVLAISSGALAAGSLVAAAWAGVWIYGDEQPTR